MFFRAFSYLRFLLKSQNQHGLHSPFVYDFVTKGLYKKTTRSPLINQYSEFKNLSKKEQKILSKILNYFKIHEIAMSLNSSTISLDKTYKLFYVSKLHKINIDKFSSKSIIIIHGIQNNSNACQKWNEIIKTHEASVTIDLYYFGLVFFRKGQRKEHFIIRV